MRSVGVAQRDEGRRGRVAELHYAYDRQPKRPVAACNLCGGQRWIPLTERDRYGFPASACACTRCGLAFLNPVMTPEAYQAFYVRVYRPLVSAYHNRRIDAGTIQDEQRVYAAALGDLLERCAAPTPGGRLLDIGGSTGVVAHVLSRRFGLDATVLDPAPLELEEASRLGLKTVAGLVEDFQPGQERFDVVILCQTADHLLDVRGTLEKVRQLIAPAGWLFIDIVDFRAAYRRHWRVEEAVKIDHPYYLTEPTMEAYLRRAGFAVARSRYAADRLHIDFVARPCEPQPGALPPPESVAALLQEIRSVPRAPTGTV